MRFHPMGKWRNLGNSEKIRWTPLEGNFNCAILLSILSETNRTLKGKSSEKLTRIFDKITNNLVSDILKDY